MKFISWIVGFVIIAALLWSGWYVYTNYFLKNTVPAPVSTSPEALTLSEVTIGSAKSTNTATTIVDSVAIMYTDAGFSSKNVAIAVGDRITFTNNSSHSMWVAADAHPTHTQYDGTSKDQHCVDGKDTNGSFDQCSAVAAGGSYSYTFTKTGTFNYHNHVRAQDTGTITVK